VRSVLTDTIIRSTGTAWPTGKPYEQTCISVVRTDDDALITHYLDYWNPLVAIEARLRLPHGDRAAHPAFPGVGG
jgi:ketosteroid isomerase-like protein